MIEREKMIAGQIYNPIDVELELDRLNAKTLCLEYNSLDANDRQGKKNLLNRLVGKCGENITIEPNFFCDYGYNLEFGENFYINHNSVFLDCAKIVFGDNVFIGPNCGFYTAGHPVVAEERNTFLEYANPICVGDNVWIGGNCVVLQGVTIGEGSVIGAGSVVTKDIPSNVVAFGNPCRVIRQITENDRILGSKQNA